MAGNEPQQQSGTITIGQVARLLMISEERVRQLVKAGYIPKSARGVYPLVGAIQGYIRSLKDDQKNTSKTAGDSRVRDARAQEIEIRIAEKRRELIPIEDATAALDKTLATVVAELAGLPARVTRDVPTRRAIEKELDAARNRMAASLRASAAAIRTGGDVFADPAEAEPGSVGAPEPEVPRKRGRPRST
ncbi:hypothetical protein [Mesorhizobium sp. M2A.F.Ca.ET.039.01.1.1]|uniref:hypothetical protein n=1 Tax=Mesorhizobium sp. M2A.F.Ca.ET.039.01.1.1 TaxID=2496746 RepID=UPI001FDEEE56|nr:hypothetical protein [Mesorhizobium sp. M2A.F.Ca.ET.039.01.1.1]